MSRSGIDGGSTSTKAVLTDGEGRLLAKAYQLSKGNPLQDAREVLGSLRQQVGGPGSRLHIRGAGTTGYAKDIMKEALGADVAIPETVAHAQSALRYYPNVDVIADVGGQDIKVIIIQQGGWQPHEIMAGLAKVLPKNVWLYVVQETNLTRFGRTFLLQGGTHYNLAVVKTQRDFISARVPDAHIYVHPHAGESGALGAALEAIRVMSGRASSFIGFDRVAQLSFTATRDESTRCVFCKNKCLRTFVDIETTPGQSNRFIAATCERGTVESIEEVRAFNTREAQVKIWNHNSVAVA